MSMILVFMAGCLASPEQTPSEEFTLVVVADTHYGSAEKAKNDLQLEHINSISGKTYPFGGAVKTPDAVFVLGDLVHETSAPPSAFFDEYNQLTSPVYETPGCHDRPPVIDVIEQRHGSIYYGVQIGPIWFQSMG